MRYAALRYLADFKAVWSFGKGQLYCFFVISHNRRRILHCNVTSHPTSLWIVQQLREAFPFDSAPRFLIFDRDAKYGLEVPAAVHSLKMSPVRTSFDSPWQNGIAERWVGSCRRDLLDHVIALNQRHLKRVAVRIRFLPQRRFILPHLAMWLRNLSRADESLILRCPICRP